MKTIRYGVEGAVATITLDRPDALNTIVPPLPEEAQAAVTEAVRDDAVKVIVLRGAGREGVRAVVKRRGGPDNIIEP